jgi:hypothetical protein
MRMEERGVLRCRLPLQKADFHLDTLLSQVLGATGRHRVRVGDRRDDAHNPGAADEVGARGLLPLVRTGLEGDDQRRPASPVSRRRQRHGLRVPLTELGVEALADYFPIPEHHGAHQRIRRHAPPPLPRQLDGTRHRVRLAHAHSL